MLIFNLPLSFMLSFISAIEASCAARSFKYALCVCVYLNTSMKKSLIWHQFEKGVFNCIIAYITNNLAKIEKVEIIKQFLNFLNNQNYYRFAIWLNTISKIWDNIQNVNWMSCQFKTVDDHLQRFDDRQNLNVLYNYCVYIQNICIQYRITQKYII